MDNLLPKFQSFALSNNGISDRSQWKPSDAVVVTRNPSNQRRITNEKNLPLTNYEINKLAPNDRYKKIVYEGDDPSPLSIQER